MKKLAFMFVLVSFAALPAAAQQTNNSSYSGVTLGKDSAKLSAATTAAYRNETEYHGTTLGDAQPTYHGSTLGRAVQHRKKYVYDTSLTHALKIDDEDRVRTLTYTNIDVNEYNYAGLTPLAIAAERGPLSVVKMLVQKGADVNKRSSYGVTPLITATAAQNTDEQRGIPYFPRGRPDFER